MYNVPVSIVDSRIDSIRIIGTEILSESCCAVSGVFPLEIVIVVEILSEMMIYREH